MRRIQCEHCQCMFVGKARQRFCSKGCAPAGRPKSFFQAMGRKGHAARSAKEDRNDARFQRLADGLEPWRAFKAGVEWQRKQHYDVATTRVRRAAFAQGYEQALQDMKRARVA